MSQRSESSAAHEIPPGNTEGEASSLPPGDAAAHTTSVMSFDDLEEFRQAARDRTLGETEADRVTPTAPTPSPFPQSSPPPTKVAPGPRVPGTPETDPALKSRRRFAAARAAVARSFAEASWPKRATVALLPFVIGLYGVSAFRRTVMPARPAQTTAASGPASASADAPPALASAAAQVSKTGNLPTAHPSAAVDARASGITLQRQAVDAFAAGNFQEAAALYQRLASENPGQPAYTTASRIAQDKAHGAAYE